MARVVYGYFKFDSNGLLDNTFLKDKWEITCNILSLPSSSDKSGKLIHANGRFAEKRFKNVFRWTPSPGLEKEIFDKIFK